MGFGPLAENNLVAWREWKNTSGETCPAFGVIKITGSTNGVLQGDKPDATGLKNVMVNGPVTVANGDTGICTNSSPSSILYDTGDTPGNDEDWGTTSGQWYLAKGEKGFRAIGENANGRGVFDFLSGSGAIPDPTAVGQIMQAESDGGSGFVWVAKLLELT